MRKIFGRDTAVAILDRENDDAWLDSELDVNRGTVRTVLTGVFKKVVQQLAK